MRGREENEVEMLLAHRSDVHVTLTGRVYHNIR